MRVCLYVGLFAVSSLGARIVSAQAVGELNLIISAIATLNSAAAYCVFAFEAGTNCSSVQSLATRWCHE